MINKRSEGISSKSGLPYSTIVVNFEITGITLIVAYCEMMTYHKQDASIDKLYTYLTKVVKKYQVFDEGRKDRSVNDYTYSMNRLDVLVVEEEVMTILTKAGYGDYFRHLFFVNNHKQTMRNLRLSKLVESDLGLNTNGPFYHAVDGSEKVFDAKDTLGYPEIDLNAGPNPFIVRDKEKCFPLYWKDSFAGSVDNKIKDGAAFPYQEFFNPLSEEDLK